MTNACNPEKTTFDPRQYWEQRLERHEGLVGVGYTSLGRHYNHWLYRLRRIVFFRCLKPLKLDWQQQRVLDVGSGTGFYLRLWKELGVLSPQGCDLTDVAVKRLCRLFPECQIRQLDLTGADVLPCSTYDVISVFDVLFHIVDDSGFKQALHNIYAALRPGGLFVFTDNFVHGEAIRSGHQVCRPLADISSMLLGCGFSIEKRTPVFITMNGPLDSNSRVYRWAWKQLSRLLHRSEALGYLIGLVLFGTDWVLTGVLSESPTTELMICRKSG